MGTLTKPKYLSQLLTYNKDNDIPVSESVQNAIDKHFKIHQKALSGEYIYDGERVDRYIDFVETEFYKTDGVMEKIKLQPVQKWWFELIFGYETLDGEILFQEVLLVLSRGSGKSTIMAAIEMIWMILEKYYGGESAVIAYDNLQARHIFDQVKNQITTGDGLFKKLGDTEMLKTTKTGIVFTPNKNSFMKQTNDVSRAQGGSTSLNLFDELHTYKTDIVSAVNKGSKTKQKRWRSLYITSGGMVRGYLFDDMLKRFKSERSIESDREIGLIYQLDDKDEVSNENSWAKAAPMIKAGIPNISAIREDFQQASGDPALQNQFLAYYMGLQSSDVSAYILPEESRAKAYDFEDVWTGAKVTVGIDISLVDDFTSIAFTTKKDGITYVHSETIATRDSLAQMSKGQRAKLEAIEESDTGFHVTDEPVIRAKYIFEIFKNFVEKYSLITLFVGYDPSRAEMLTQLIETYFFDVDEALQAPVKQGFALSEPTKLLKTLLKGEKIIHQSKILEWSMNNFGVKIGVSGDIMPRKISSPKKIDPVVALIIALNTDVIK